MLSKESNSGAAKIVIEEEGNLQERVYRVVYADNRSIRDEGKCDKTVGNPADDAICGDQNR